MELSRRSVVRASAVGLGCGTLAGCLSEPEFANGSEGGYAAFFALADWTRHVADGRLAIENPVETGTMGHGWEPSADLQRDVAGSRAFVYLDNEAFRWAGDVAAALEDEYEITLIDGMTGLEEYLVPVDGSHDHDHGDHDDHDHGDPPEDYDPHVWTDPVIAREIVGTIASGLGEADPDNADRYEESAATYAERLDAVDERFADVAANASRDVAVLAGHDSFRYLEERYGFDLHTPVGVSPDDVESTTDVTETVAVVEDHGIDTILYDPFETSSGDDVPELVDVIRTEVDAGIDAAPITTGAGTMASWSDRGYGWIEQMEEITIPSLEEALDAR